MYVFMSYCMRAYKLVALAVLLLFTFPKAAGSFCLCFSTHQQNTGLIFPAQHAVFIVVNHHSCSPSLSCEATYYTVTLQDNCSVLFFFFASSTSVYLSRQFLPRVIIFLFIIFLNLAHTSCTTLFISLHVCVCVIVWFQPISTQMAGTGCTHQFLAGVS